MAPWWDEEERKGREKMGKRRQETWAEVGVRGEGNGKEGK